eukprot:m51a1_g8878 hypothetical protein (819) ;mRNA; r:629058-631912
MDDEQRQERQQQQAGAQAQVPESFVCALTGEVMSDPVIDPEGHTYERAAIERWLGTRSATSPVTRSPLRPADLVPNRALREAIEQFYAARGLSVPAPKPAPEGGSEAPQAASGAGPAAQAQVPADVGRGDVSVVVQAAAAGGEGDVLVSLRPAAGRERTPLDVCCVVDVSGSMGEEATVQSPAGVVERHGLSLLDVVCHAVRTIAHVLGPGDRLALVSYSSMAATRLALTPMDQRGRKAVDAALDALVADGTTNLWDGLRTGLDVLGAQEKQRAGGPPQRRAASVLLLTDGMPNVEPPRGHLPMLRRYRDQKGGLPVVNTFGFGYSLDSALLLAIAAETGGTYAFIPDAGFVGTAFINATANLLATCATRVRLSLVPCHGASVDPAASAALACCRPAPAGLVDELGATGVHFALGSLRHGQSADLVVRMRGIPADAATPFAIATLEYEPVDGSGPVRSSCESQPARDGGCGGDVALEVEAHRLRHAMIAAVDAAMRAADAGDYDRAAAVAREFAAAARASAAAGDRRVRAMAQDVEGQVAQALGRGEWYARWGRHYLPSLLRAHLLQQCNNFKDPGVQVYGGPLFARLRDEADDVFASLPAPRPTARALPPERAAAGAPAGRRTGGTVSMACYHNASGGCFSGGSAVELADGTQRPVRDLRRGDAVWTPQGPARVVCLVCMRCAGGRAELCSVGGCGLLATPWHPVLVAGAWVFPADVARAELVACEAVYNVVLERGHVARVGGVQAVTLGHGFSGDVREHAYWGTAAVLGDLAAMQGWDEGCVELGPDCVVRDAKTSLVCRIVRGPSVASLQCSVDH